MPVILDLGPTIIQYDFIRIAAAKTIFLKVTFTDSGWKCICGEGALFNTGCTSTKHSINTGCQNYDYY